MALPPLPSFSPDVVALMSEDISFHRTLFDTLPLGVVIVDRQGIITYCNERQAQIDGMAVGDIVGKSEVEVYGPYIGPGIIVSCMETGTPLLGYVCQYRTRTGKLVSGGHWVYPLRKGGEVVAALCLVQPISTKSSLLLTGKQLANGHIPDSPLPDEDHSPRAPDVQVIGSNAAFRRMLNTAETTASSPSAVLISGETGTGKELIVNTIRNAGDRRDKPYLAVNCSAIPETLLEAMMFGVTKGSFTGAIERRGLFEEADGGIIYLDEVDSMPLSLQPKLLRVLQDMKVRRLGSAEERALNVKVISSISMAPEAALAEGRLRLDLFYRLAVITLRIPPLRERKDDLKDLADHFVAKYNHILKKNVKEIEPAVYALFEAYDWPGNVRELEHVIAGAINITAWEEVLRVHHIPEYQSIFMKEALRDGRAGHDALHAGQRPMPSTASSPAGTLRDQEIAAVETALAQAMGRISDAAAILGISRQLLHYKLKKYGIDRKRFAIR